MRDIGINNSLSHLFSRFTCHDYVSHDTGSQYYRDFTNEKDGMKNVL